MYFFLRGLRRKCLADSPHWVQLVGAVVAWVVLIANLERYFPETELRWVDPLETVSVLADNMLLKHAECLCPVELYREGACRLCLVDEAEEGYEIAHCLVCVCRVGE